MFSSFCAEVHDTQHFLARRLAYVKRKKQKQKERRRKGLPLPFRRCTKSSGVFTNYIGYYIRDTFYLHKNLFTWNSFKIITATFPLFIGSRMIDEKLQNKFYDASWHKNINQLPKWCQEIAKWSVGVPMFLLGSQAFFNRDKEFRTTSQVFLVGLPFVIFGKDLIKKFRFEACLRPWHEKFSCEERSSGGFPSGHVAEATYAALLYGLRYGPKYGVPLGALTAFVGVTFLSCNRHYLSQLVAGAGFGAMYALAAHKLIDSKLNKDLNINVSVNEHGGPTLSLSYRF